MFDKCASVANMMNEAGKKRIPFLFGMNYELTEGFFVAEPKKQTDILFQINGVSNFKRESKNTTNYSFDIHPIGIDKYRNKFDSALKSMTTMGVDLINLTVKTPISTSLSLHEILKYSNAKYCIMVPERFVCFSPEIFVRTMGNKILSYPMKGTIDANISNAESIILNNKKEIEEHKIAIKLIEDDISKIASNVTTTRFRYVEKIENNKGALLQVSSEVQGVLPSDFWDNIGTYIMKLLPAGSISGHPKADAMDIIRSNEDEDRGFYTGIVGYFDGENIDCGVLIRFIEQDGVNLFFRSGGGVTLDSNWESEYSEVLKKVYLPF